MGDSAAETASLTDDNVLKEIRGVQTKIRKLESSVDSCATTIGTVSENCTRNMPPSNYESDTLNLKNKIEILEACLNQHIAMFQALEASRASSPVYRAGFPLHDSVTSLYNEDSPTIPSPQREKGGRFRIGGSFSNLYKHNEDVDIAGSLRYFYQYFLPYVYHPYSLRFY
jgi:hypothetical protein